MNNQAPARAIKFLRWFCKEDHLEEIEGNLIELYEAQYQEDAAKAKRIFYWNVLLHFRPEYIRPLKISSPQIQFDMFQNYLKVAFRNIGKNKAFSAINIAGLVLGMVCFLFIFLWVEDERSIDNFHESGNRLFNIYQNTRANGQINSEFTTFHKNGEDGKIILPLSGIKEAIPEVEKLNFYATGYELPWGHPETFQREDKVYKLNGSRAGADFFKMFNYPIIAGNKIDPLSDKSSLAISKKMSDLFFDSPEEAIGKSIHYENRLDLEITAVFEEVTAKSSLQFDFLINWDLHTSGKLEWASHQILTTIQLAAYADEKTVESKINEFIKLHLDQNESTKIEVGLQPFKDQYLVANFVNGKPQGGRIEYVRIFSGVAIFILLLACINFMNLSTARSGKRAKEVGIRKVIGSSRSHLIRQFLGESVWMALIALVLSLLCVKLLLPYFNNFTGKSIEIPFSEPTYWLLSIGLMVVTGVVAGSYPALFLASLRPVKVLNGIFRFTRSSNWFRKGLTIFQFTLSIFLLIAAVVVSQQTSYIQDSHLGYDRENLLYLRVEGELMQQNKYNLFKSRASKMPGIAMVDRSSEAPHIMGFEVTDPVNWEGKEENAAIGFMPSSVGYDFIKLMNLEIVEGRDFSKAITTDSADAFIVNEEAVRQMGMNDPIGKRISAWDKGGHIIGVLKDYHTQSLHQPIKPIIIDVKEYEYFGVILIRTKAGETETALASLEKVYQELNPKYPFEYQFIDQEYQALYKSEQVISKLSNVFALLSILVSCLGLLGLAMFSAERRLKEISIRKVLGANISNILILLFRDFIFLIGLSIFIAIPISWLVMSNWLQSFAYRIDLSWGIFAITGLAVVFIGFCTICSQSLKVAFVNPVKALKNE